MEKSTGPQLLEDELMPKEDLDAINTRIRETIKAIVDIKAGNEEKKSRSQLIAELKVDISKSYDYNSDLVDVIFDLFSPENVLEFVESNEVARPLTIRTNTLKTKRRDLARILLQKGVHLEPIGPWTKVGLTIFNSNIPIGATTEYLAGYYMLQAASSLLPVMALDPQENEHVLDMSAAPGGKTTYISQLMKNTGTLVANDSNKERCRALIANIQRLGVNNAIVINYDGRKIPKAMNTFDRVLLDAPCSGTGVIAKDPTVKTERKTKDILRNAHIQKELILAAIDAINPHSKTGGILVYSTCSITVDEDESVIQYALNHRYVKIISTDIEVGEPGITNHKGKQFDQAMKLCRRIYPHIHNMDGFFYAKLKKFANGAKMSEEEKKDKKEKDEVAMQENKKTKELKKEMHEQKMQCKKKHNKERENREKNKKITEKQEKETKQEKEEDVETQEKKHSKEKGKRKRVEADIDIEEEKEDKKPKPSKKRKHNE